MAPAVMFSDVLPPFSMYDPDLAEVVLAVREPLN